MKLRTQFFVGAGILVVVLVALAVVAITTGIRVSDVRNQHDITASIEQHANDLSYVSNNYLLYRERTQKLEWDSLFASLSADLGRLAPSGPEEASLISNLRANSARLRQVFADVVSLGESPAGATGVEYRTSLQTSWSRMEVQNRQIVSDASRLERLLEVREDRAVQMSSITIYGLVAVACLLLLAGYFFSYRRTIAGILALQAGTEIVGTGDLDQVIPEDGNDELGALSRAFNKMTRDLKSVAYRYESQRSIAVKLQQTLLDIPRPASGVQFSHLYRSATLDAAVGGDFYDVFEVKDGQVVLLIGDVSGHGVEAARVATLVKDVVHAFVHQLAEPSAVMESTNELLIEKGLTGFVTLFLGILDPRTGALRYCSAGHPNTLIRSAGGQVELLEAGSAPLGVFPDYVWGDSEASIKPNDIVFLYTDGTIEARRNGDFFGQTGLITAITHWEGDHAQDLPQAVLGAVLAFAGGALADDVAMVSVQLSADADADAAKVGLSA